MTAKRRRKRRTQVNRRIAPVLAALVLIVLIAAALFISYLIDKYSPSKERMAWTEYYSTTEEDEVAVILNNELTELKGRMIDGEVYVTTDTLYDYLNHRFYWDQAENLLLYTTPTEVVTAAVGSETYTAGSESFTESYAPVKVDGDTAYVALAYIQKYTGLQYEVMTDEVNRVNITTEFGAVDTAQVKRDAQVRYRAGIKSPILTDVAKGETLYILPEDEDVGDWTKVRTANGFIGYIRNKFLGARSQETLTSNYEEPEYTNITKDYTINMAWHQVANSDANSNVLEMIANTKGLTTISPTWFFLCDNEGNIESLASQTYVNYCHQNGIEVWGLVEDITYKDSIVDYEILSRTSSRQRLVSNLIAKAIEFDLDGLDVLPASEDLWALDLETRESCRYSALMQMRDAVEEDGTYDVMIVDCPPNLSAACVSAILASDAIIIPVLSDACSATGVADLVDQIDSLRYIRPDIRVAGVLVNQWHRSPVVEDAAAYLREDGRVPVYDTVIRRTDKVPESSWARMAVQQWSPWCSAARDYRAWTAELLAKEGMKYE